MSFFSIICPVYNSEKYIKKTIDSILMQNVSDFELIIIDDGSQDKSVKILNYLLKETNLDYKIIQSTWKGPGSARNLGIKAAKYEWIAFIDSDDTWEPAKLEIVKNAILQNPKINFLCHREYFISKNRFKYEVKPIILDYNKSICSQLYFRNLFSTSAVVLKRDLLIKHGIFDEKLLSAQDYELWLKLSPHINVLMLEDVLGTYVQREGNITSGSIIPKYKNIYKIAWRYSHYTNNFGIIKKMITMLLRFFRDSVNKCFT